MSNTSKFITLRKLVLLFVLFCYTGMSVSQTYAPGACKAVPGSQSCLDATPCKQSPTGETVCLTGVALPAGAITTPQTCWQYAYQYACTGKVVNTCAPFESNPACAVVSSNCSLTTPETGLCSEFTNVYKCQTQAQKTQQQMVCSNGLFNSQAMPTPSNPNSSFASAAVAQEIMREGQVYGKNGIFSGVSESCTEGYYGIRNCCNSAPGAKSNSALLGVVTGAGFGVVKYAGEKIIDAASPYVYDAMYSAGVYTQGLTSNLFDSGASTLSTGTNLAANGLSFGAYGFTYGTGSYATYESSSMIGGSMNIGESIGLGADSGFLAFNPYVFAIMVCIMIIESLASCTEDEQMLAMHRGASLSSFMVKECSNTFLGSCNEWTSKYCSFNSVLAKIVNIQGKPQLGLGLSDCAGMTPTQLSQLDFTKIDFSEFTQGLVNSAKNNLPTNISKTYTPILQSTPKGTAQTNTTNLPSYPAQP